MNVVVLQGTLSSEPSLRTLGSGSQLVQLEVTTRGEDGTSSVPVAWFDPPQPVTLTVTEFLSGVTSANRRWSAPAISKGTAGNSSSRWAR